MAMQDLDLRQAIMENMKNSPEEHVRETIVDAIEQGEEKTLPGLGVLFEVLWNKSTQQQQEVIVKTLAENLKV